MPRREAFATTSTACEMSPTRLPARAAAMPAASAFSVFSTSARTSGGASPTITVRALSPMKPPHSTVMSTETTSPSLTTTSSRGTPWMTASFTEMHVCAG